MNIVEIQPNGLKLVKSNGEFIVLDFEECKSNWIAYKKRRNELIHEGINDIIIGQRDSWSDRPYIEFFTKPFTKVEFESVVEYKRIRDTINEYGYRTVDLS